jgi:peptidoglycan/xylan/chitin deacetylase (PgdA/CDA1 family)
VFCLAVCVVANHATHAKSKLQMVFRLDDCYLDSDSATQKILRLFIKHNIAVNVGMIPCNPQLFLQAQHPDSMYFHPQIEIIMHGYRHKKITEGEFKNIPYWLMRQKVRAGTDTLNEYGIYPLCFAPPWNAYDKRTLELLRENGLYMISANEFGDRSNSDMLYLPATCYSVQDAIDQINGKHYFGGVLVLLIHPYQINTQSDLLLLEKLLLLIKNKKIETLRFTEFVKRKQNISAERMKLHHQPLIYGLRKLQIMGFNQRIYYDYLVVYIINLIEWMILIIILVLFHIKFCVTKSYYTTYIVGIVLLLGVMIIMPKREDSYRWALLYKTSIIALFIWVNNLLQLRKKSIPKQAR